MLLVTWRERAWRSECLLQMCPVLDTVSHCALRSNKALHLLIYFLNNLVLKGLANINRKRHLNSQKVGGNPGTAKSFQVVLGISNQRTIGSPYYCLSDLMSFDYFTADISFGIRDDQE